MIQEIITLNILYQLFSGEGVSIGDIQILFKGNYYATNSFINSAMNRELIGFDQHGRYKQYLGKEGNKDIVSIDVDAELGIIIKINK